MKILSDYFGVSQYFDVIRGSDESVGRYSKADVIRQVIADAGIDRIDRCVMVGDRRFDAEGAAECGMDSIGVLYGYGSRQELTEAGATYFAGSVEELGRMLGV